MWPEITEEEKINFGDIDIGTGKLIKYRLLLLTSLSAGLSAGSPGLNLEFLAPLLEKVDSLLGPSGKVNVNRGTHASS